MYIPRVKTRFKTTLSSLLALQQLQTLSGQSRAWRGGSSWHIGQGSWTVTFDCCEWVVRVRYVGWGLVGVLVSQLVVETLMYWSASLKSCFYGVGDVAGTMLGSWPAVNEAVLSSTPSTLLKKWTCTSDSYYHCVVNTVSAHPRVKVPQ